MLVQICKMDRGGIESFYLKCLSVEDKGVTAECNVRCLNLKKPDHRCDSPNMTMHISCMI